MTTRKSTGAIIPLYIPTFLIEQVTKDKIPFAQATPVLNTIQGKKVA